MSTGVVTPDLAGFRKKAKTTRVVPVVRRLLADAETPVGVYRKLAGGPGTFLLESAEQGAASAGSAWSRYSFVGVRSAATLTEKDGRAHWLGTPPKGLPQSGDPIEVLRATLTALASDPKVGGLPPLTGGLVGFFGYDMIRRFERLPSQFGRPGSGIGLYISRWLAERQGGSITVESEPGVGSTFVFLIPSAPAPGAACGTRWRSP